MGEQRHPVVMAQAPGIEFTPEQIDRLGHWLSECLDDAAPLNERLWRRRAEWMVKGPTFQQVLREVAAGFVRPEDVAEAQATRDLTDEEVADALLLAEALCRVRHPNRWSTVVEQRVTCLSCKETAIREARAEAAEAERDEAWKVAAQRRSEARRYYVAWQVARMRARALRGDS